MPGWVFLDLSGEVVEKDLAPGEVLQVHVGHVGVQDASVEFGVRMLKGFKNMLFGGDEWWFYGPRWLGSNCARSDSDRRATSFRVNPGRADPFEPFHGRCGW